VEALKIRSSRIYAPRPNWSRPRVERLKIRSPDKVAFFFAFAFVFWTYKSVEEKTEVNEKKEVKVTTPAIKRTLWNLLKK